MLVGGWQSIEGDLVCILFSNLCFSKHLGNRTSPDSLSALRSEHEGKSKDFCFLSLSEVYADVTP